MLIELIKNKEILFNLCYCNDHRYIKDAENRAFITSDNIRFFQDQEKKVKELLQFPYTCQEYDNKDYDKYRCKKCGVIPYRIIKSINEKG